jgi:hypothetical protein
MILFHKIVGGTAENAAYKFTGMILVNTAQIFAGGKRGA